MKTYKVGIISDIHGNLLALNAVLDLLDGLGCDEIIHTGDVVDIGPRSKECLEILLNRPKTTLLFGNHDRDYWQDNSEHKLLSHVSAQHKRFVYDSIGNAYREAVGNFPLSVVREFGGKKVLFCHYALSGASKAEYSFKTIESHPTAEKFDELFCNMQPFDAVFFGHKHELCDIVGKSLYVDVGSVGCHQQAEARGIVLEVASDGFSYRRVAAPYNRRAVLDDMLSSGLPDAQYLFDFYFDHLNGEHADLTKDKGNK